MASCNQSTLFKILWNSMASTVAIFVLVSNLLELGLAKDGGQSKVKLPDIFPTIDAVRVGKQYDKNEGSLKKTDSNRPNTVNIDIKINTIKDEKVNKGENNGVTKSPINQIPETPKTELSEVTETTASYSTDHSLSGGSQLETTRFTTAPPMSQPITDGGGGEGGRNGQSWDDPWKQETAPGDWSAFGGSSPPPEKVIPWPSPFTRQRFVPEDVPGEINQIPDTNSMLASLGQGLGDVSGHRTVSEWRSYGETMLRVMKNDKNWEQFVAKYHIQ